MRNPYFTKLNLNMFRDTQLFPNQKLWDHTRDVLHPTSILVQSASLQVVIVACVQHVHAREGGGQMMEEHTKSRNVSRGIGSYSSQMECKLAERAKYSRNIGGHRQQEPYFTLVSSRCFLLLASHLSRVQTRGSAPATCRRVCCSEEPTGGNYIPRFLLHLGTNKRLQEHWLLPNRA